MLDKPKDLRTIAEEAFAMHVGDDDLMHQYILRHARRSNDVMDEIINRGIDETIRHQYTVNRRTVAREPIEPEEREAIIEKIAKVRSYFWDRYTLFGHMPLKEATADDLRTSAGKRRQQAQTSLRRARFEMAMADEMGTSKKTVPKFFTVDRVIELAEKHNAT